VVGTGVGTVGSADRLSVAVDWSGDARAESTVHPKLWIAEAVDGELIALAPTSRAGAADAIVEAADRAGDGLVAGLDFSFAYPAWFMRELGCSSGPEVWGRTLDPSRPPFYGAKGTTAPAPDRRYRETEARLRASGHRCGSTFQVRGPGSVGTGTLRGLPHLRRLARAGLRVWPFDLRPGPVVAEVDPRMFTGPVVKSLAEARAAAWSAARVPAPPALRDLALAGEDAFDAALTAVALSRGVTGAADLPPIASLEGWVWGA
jgi:hypothetical protein